MKKNNQGFVYVMQGLDYIKIGFSKDPNTRLFNLNSNSLPFEIELIATLKSDIAHDLEQELHSKYKLFRVRKEWFLLPEFELLNMIKDYGFTIISDFQKRVKEKEYEIMKLYATVESNKMKWEARSKVLLQFERDSHRERMREIENNTKKEEVEKLILFLGMLKDKL